MKRIGEYVSIIMLLIISNNVSYAQINIAAKQINEKTVDASYKLAQAPEPLKFGLKEVWAYGSYTDQGINPQMGDINGDGLADVLVIQDDRVVVRKSNGCEFGPEENWFFGNYSYGDGWNTFADVNGDNRVDLIKLTQYKARVKLNPGFANTNYPYNLWLELASPDIFGAYGTRIVDLNNDGKADLIGGFIDGIVVFPSTGSSFSEQNVQNWSNGHYQDFDEFLDANNDGFPDIYHEFELNGQSAVWVELSNGTSFPDPINYSNMWEEKDNISVYDYADFTADGKADLVFKNNIVRIKRSTGTGFTGYETWLDSDDFGANYSIYNNFVDVNGDGRADLVAFLDDRVEVRRTIYKCELNILLLVNNQLIAPDNRGKNITTFGNLSLNSGQTANLSAGESVVFNPGFNAYQGSNLVAGIRACPSSQFGCRPFIEEKQSTDINNLNLSEEETTHIQQLKIIPNPSQGYAKLIFKKLSQKTELTVLNNKGVSVLKKLLSPNLKETTLNFENLPKGIYFIKLGSNPVERLIIN